MSTGGIFWFFFSFSFICYEHIPQLCWEICFCSSSYKILFKINTLFLSEQMSLRRLATLYKNPRARLNLSVSLVEGNKQNLPILGKDNNGVYF